jgi:hypothetical protein
MSIAQYRYTTYLLTVAHISIYRSLLKRSVEASTGWTSTPSYNIEKSIEKPWLDSSSLLMAIAQKTKKSNG